MPRKLTKNLNSITIVKPMQLVDILSQTRYYPTKKDAEYAISNGFIKVDKNVILSISTMITKDCIISSDFHKDLIILVDKEN